MKILLITYLTISLLYGFYSLLMQKIRHPYHIEKWRMLLVFFVNLIFMPFSITFAIVNKSLYSKNLILALKDQGPFKRAFRNFVITGNARGVFSLNSHIRVDTGKPKVMFNTQVSAAKSANAMAKKHNVHFSYYKCIFCDGYHIGKNRDNKK